MPLKDKIFRQFVCQKQKYKITSAKLQSKDKIFPWMEQFILWIFSKKPNLPEEEISLLFQSNEPHFIYVDTTQVSEHFVQDILPQALDENYVVSLLTLNDQTLFQDWFVWYPKGITTTKQTSSLFEHHDIIPTFLGISVFPTTTNILQEHL